MKAGSLEIEIKATGVKDVEGKLNGLGNKIKSGLNLGKLALGVTAVNQALGVARQAFSAVNGVIGGAIRSYAEFEDGLTNVATLLKEQAGKYLPDYEKQLINISNRYGVAATQLTKPLYDLISASVPAGKAVEMLDLATKAAKVGIADAGTAVDALTTSLNAWHLPMEQATNVMDMFQMAIKRGKTTLGEIGSSLSLVAPLAAKLGVPLEQITGALATMTKQGIPTSQAMTQLSAVMRSVLQNQGRAAQFGPKVAAIFNKQALETMGLQKWVVKLNEALGGDENAMTKLLGRAEALQAVLALTGDNAKTAAEDLDAMKNSAGELGEGFNEVKKGFGFQWGRLKTQIQNLGIVFGSMLAPAIKTLTAVLKPVISLLQKLMEQYKKLPNAMQAAIPVIAALTAAFVAFQTGIFSAVIPSITAVWTSLGPILPVIAGITGAIALLGVAWKKNFLGIKDITAKVWKVVKVVFGLVWNNIKIIANTIYDVLKPALTSVWKAVKEAYEFVKPYAKYLLIILAAPFTPLAAIIGAAITALITFKNAVVNIVASIKPLFYTLLDVISTAFNPKNWLHPGKIKDKLDEFGKVVQDTMSKTAKGVLNDVKATFDKIKGTVDKAKKDISSASPEAEAGAGVGGETTPTSTGGGGMGSSGESKMYGLVVGFTPTISPAEMIEEYGKQMEEVSTETLEVYNELGEKIEEKSAEISENVSGILGRSVGDFFDSLFDKTTSFGEKVKGLFKSIGDGLKRLAAQQISESVSKSIQPLLLKANTYILTAISKIFNWLAGTLGPFAIPAGIAAAGTLIGAFLGFRKTLGLAEGGLLATGPAIVMPFSGGTPAIIGEAGPEIVAPKEKFDDLYGEGGGKTTIVINAPVIERDNIIEFADMIDKNKQNREFLRH